MPEYTTETEYKYVWLNHAAQNCLGTIKGKMNGDQQVREPTLDQLTEDGWEPFRETVVGTTSIFVILKRSKRVPATGTPRG